MPGMHLFEYAVIRVVPRVEREEFINVGVIIYCAKLKYLKASIHLDTGKIQALDKTVDEVLLANHLQAIIDICDATKKSGPIGRLDNASRFRWLTATRSTIVQCSKVHPGFSENIDSTLAKLITELVR